MLGALVIFPTIGKFCRDSAGNEYFSITGIDKLTNAGQFGIGIFQKYKTFGWDKPIYHEYTNAQDTPDFVPKLRPVQRATHTCVGQTKPAATAPSGPPH
jgi:hypothetical protein